MTVPKHDIAHRLINAAFHRKATTPLTDDHPDLDVEAAYEVQNAVVQARVDGGAAIIGAKLGLTSLAKQKQMNVTEPLYGWLTDDMQLDTGDTLVCSNYIQPRCEPEVAFLLAEDLEQAKLELAGTILGFQKIKKKEVEPEPFIPMGKGVFWPSMSYWWKQLAMWRERSRPGPDSPKKPTSISLGVSAEVLSGEALPEVREGQKMVCGPIQAAPVVAEPASEKPVVKSDAGGATAKAAKVSKEKRVRGKRVELPPAPSLPGTIG